MKKRHLLILTSSLFLLVAGVLFYPAQKKYQPRSLNASTQGYNDALEYYKLMKADPETGEVDAGLIVRIAESVRQFSASKDGAGLNVTWEEVGPDNIGGRTRAILIVNEELMFAGSVSGGLFKTENKGNTWERIPGFNKNYAVSTIAILGNGHIYVGTGNTHEFANGNGGSGSIGGGLFVSTDGGVTWDYALDEDGSPIKPSTISVNTKYSFFDKIIADPNVDNKLWVGSNTFFKAYVEGEGFLATPTGIPTIGCEDVDISTNGSVIMVSMIGGIGRNGFISNDGGDSFSVVSGSGEGMLPLNSQRIESDISPDDENYIYAGVVRGGKLSNVFVSTDKGNTWTMFWDTNIAGADPDPNGQGFYDLAVSVVPGDKEIVLIGALDVWSGGPNATPLQRSLWAYGIFTPGLDQFPLYVHADIHEFAWDESGMLFIGSDGGIDRTDDNAETFTNANRFYSVTQYYGIGYSANDKVIGGAQDNGTTYVTKDRSTVQEAYKVSGGDGFDCDISSLTPDGNVVFTSIQFNTILRSNDGGSTGGTFLNDVMLQLFGPFHSQLRLYETKTAQNTPYVVKFINETGSIIEAGSELTLTSNTLDVPYNVITTDDIAPDDTVLFNDPVASSFSVGYVNTGGVWVTREALQFSESPRWAKVINSISGTVTAMEWSKTDDGNYLFVGTSTGRLYRISGFANAYTIVKMSVSSPDYALSTDQIISGGNAILDISSDPSDNDHLVVARAGFGGGNKVMESFDATASNPTFNNIWFTTGNLVGLPAYSVVIEMDNPEVILVGTEFGIFATDNGGQDWTQQLDDPMGAFPIFDLRQQWRSVDDVENSGFIYVGSHGRGAFRSATFEKNGITSEVEKPENELVGDLLIAPNPMNNYGILEFTGDTEGLIDMDIYAISGQRVKTLQFTMSQGTNHFQFDVSDLRYGTYIIQLKKDNKVTTRKIVIAR